MPYGRNVPDSPLQLRSSALSWLGVARMVDCNAPACGAYGIPGGHDGNKWEIAKSYQSISIPLV